MRATIVLTVTALALAWAAPASAQMCGGGQTTGSTASASGGRMMCGMMGRAAASDPMAAPGTAQGQRAGGCPCCRNMAMMQGGMGGMMGGGSQPPAEQPTQPSAPTNPYTPDMPGMTPRPQ